MTVSRRIRLTVAALVVTALALGRVLETRQPGRAAATRPGGAGADPSRCRTHAARPPDPGVRSVPGAGDRHAGRSDSGADGRDTLLGTRGSHASAIDSSSHSPSCIEASGPCGGGTAPSRKRTAMHETSSDSYRARPNRTTSSSCPRISITLASLAARCTTARMTTRRVPRRCSPLRPTSGATRFAARSSLRRSMPKNSGFAAHMPSSRLFRSRASISCWTSTST